MATTIGDTTSRIRNVIKAVKEDPFVTDRFLYSLVLKYSKMLIRRQQNENKIMGYDILFKSIPCLELIEVDKIEACCLSIKTGCTFKRSKDKLPLFMEGNDGPIIRSVTTIDQSQRLLRTQPSTYANMSKSTYFKYNKEKYYWIVDGYLFIPDVSWEAVRVEALFDEDIDYLNCSIKESNECVKQQDRVMSVPDYLFAEIEQLVIKEIFPSMQIPSDGAHNNENVLR